VDNKLSKNNSNNNLIKLSKNESCSQYHHHHNKNYHHVNNNHSSNSNNNLNNFYSNEVLKDIQGKLKDDQVILKDSVRVKKFIAQGDYANIYLGELIPLKKLIVIKRYNLIKFEENKIKNILNEFKIIKDFSHENLVKYYTIDSSTLEENNYRSGNIDIIMEYIEGFNLKEYISRFSPIDDLKLKHICRNLLNGLDFLSSNKIIHRDLKPENILVNDTLDVVKITDFALSTYYNYINDSNIINTPTVGSPWYMAPEIVLRQSYGFDADIWSLGCIIYEMKCGQKPYNDINYNQAKIKIMEYGNPLEYAEDGIKDIFYDKSNRDILEFLLLCWRANNMFRPSAKELLNHQFLK